MKNPICIENLNHGIRRCRELGWPADLHSDFYRKVETLWPKHGFNERWWQNTLSFLTERGATWPTPPQVITERAKARFHILQREWDLYLGKNHNRSISDTSWEKVAGFVKAVAEIKNVDSPFFTSVLCNLLAPQVFPLIDFRTMGRKVISYEDYYLNSQENWKEIPQRIKTHLVDTIAEQVGDSLPQNYPLSTKIVELCIIGKRDRIKRVKSIFLPATINIGVYHHTGFERLQLTDRQIRKILLGDRLRIKGDRFYACDLGESWKTCWTFENNHLDVSAPNGFQVYTDSFEGVCVEVEYAHIFFGKSVDISLAQFLKNCMHS